MLSIPPTVVEQAPFIQQASVETIAAVTGVPFYSQFADIAKPEWQKVGCGITSLAMIIDYYSKDTVTVNTLLTQGIAAHAYQKNAGWTHAGLIKLSATYGLVGSAHYLGAETKAVALAALARAVSTGPVIASIHYKFEPANPIPHMVVITAIKDGMVHYNDPAAKEGDKLIAVTAFQKAWKQKFIEFRPV